MGNVGEVGWGSRVSGAVGDMGAAGGPVWAGRPDGPVGQCPWGAGVFSFLLFSFNFFSVYFIFQLVLIL